MASKKKVHNSELHIPGKSILRSVSQGSNMAIDMAHAGKQDTMSINTGRSSLFRFKGACSDDPRTPHGRRSQMAKILTMAGVPILVLVIQAAISMSDALKQQSYATNFQEDLDFAIQAGDLVHNLGLERGYTVFYVGIPNNDLFNGVAARRKLVDKSFATLNTWPDVKPEDHFYDTKQDLFVQIAINRILVNQSNPVEQLNFFTDIIAQVLNYIGGAVARSQASEQAWQTLTAYHLFISAKECFAAERSSGTVTFSQGNMTHEVYLWYQAKKSQGNILLNRSMQYNPIIRERLTQLYYGSVLEANVTRQRELITANNLNRIALREGRVFYAQMTAYQDILRVIEVELITNISDNLRSAIHHSGTTVGSQIFILALAIILFPSIITLLTHITGQIQEFAGILQVKNDEVMKEKQRAEAVLYQLLPRKIALKIKNREQIFPESYDQVTVFFSDVVEFTVLSSSSTPLQMVDTLNKLYTAMDSKIGTYDVYKVETIGDAYLCVSGLPERNEERHSYEVASMALELIPEIAKIRLPHKPDYALRLRIGMHTGPCAAGVVGHATPRYCVFGDTVNTASRMESNGEAMRIHMSNATNDALKYFNVFETECRGEMTIKGKGLMTTWWLLSKGEEKKKQTFGPDV